MRLYYWILPFLLLASLGLSAQNGIIGTGFTDGWDISNQVSFNDGMGDSRITILNSRQTGNAFFRLVRNWSGDLNQFGPFGCTDTDWSGGEESSYDNMPICNNSGAFFINTPNQTDNYVFKTPNGDSADDFVYFRVEGDVRNIVSVNQSPANDMNAAINPEVSVTASATLDGTLATGQVAYLYYIAINTGTLEINTAVVPMTDSGNGLTYTAQIPPFVSGTFVSYLYLTSGDQVTPAATPEDVEYRAITFDDNNGAYYSYITDQSLPVSFSNWQGNRVNRDVTLTWATSIEQNASHFILECSENGGRTWNERTQVSARNLASGSAYRYLDQNVPIGSLQYRLRQVDFDGQFAYSSILNINGSKEAGTVTVYPQPAVNGLNVNVSDNFSGGQMELYDAAGRLVKTQAISQSTERLETSMLPGGVYLLRVIGGDDSVATQRVVVE